MKTRFPFLALAALAAVIVAPAHARAQGTSDCGAYTFSLGLGGNLNGCFSGSLTQLGEDASFVSQQYYWAGNFTGQSGADNAPTSPGSYMFSDDCGSSGDGTFAFCTGAHAKAPAAIHNASGELVLGLLVPDNSNGAPSDWVYSGAASRNATALPAGYQAVLLQLTINGADDAGHFLFGWEDMNSGCTHRPTLSSNRYREEDLNNGVMLDSRLSDCDVITPGGNSDTDYNDSYMQFVIEGTGTPADIALGPEPVTMSLLATGLAGMGGASFARRRKKSQ